MSTIVQNNSTAGNYDVANGLSLTSATAALIEREGLRFDGTAGAVIGGGGIPAVGTGDFTFIAEITPASLSGIPFVIGPATVTSAFGLKITAGSPQVTNVNVADVTASSFVFTTGVPVLLAYTRAGTTGTYYANGSPVGVVTDSNNYAGPSAQLGMATSAAFINGSVSKTSIANYALTAAEIAALTRRGLVTLPEQRGGSMGLIPSFSSTALDSFSNTSNGFTAVRSSAGGNWAVYLTLPLTVKKNSRVRIAYTGTLTSGATPSLGLVSLVSTAGSAYVNATAGASTADIIATLDSNIIQFTGYGPSSFQVASIVIDKLGTLFEQDSGQRSAGYMVRDTSGNNAHLELPEAGVSIIDPADTGTIRYTRASDGWIIGDRIVIPTGYVIDFIMMKAVSGTCTAYLGSTAGASDIVSSQSLTTAWTSILDPVESSTGKIHLTRSTGSVQVQIAIRLA